MHTLLPALRRALAFVVLLGCVSACSQAALAPAVNTDPRHGQKIDLPEPANPALPSLFLIGDSTVRNGRDDGQKKGAQGQWGWGNPIAAHFDSSRINVVNRAIGGLSSRTYLTGGHWERTLALIKRGDFVIIQFGHNDNGAINDATRARASIGGTGEQAEQIDNLLTGQRETVHTYGWYLRKYVADARAKGATPIIATLVPRKRWDAGGKVVRNLAEHAGWAREVAHREGLALIDLNEAVASKYDELGRDAVLKLFPQATPDEHTHTNLAGAELNARMVVAGLPAPLKAFLRLTEDARPVVDAATLPDETARDPTLPTLFLVGDSTVKGGGQNGVIGWGERIAPFFDARKLNVVNLAIGGRSSRTFFTEGRWNKALAKVKAGDFVLIQFGHNDGGRVGDPANKNRASAPGTGPETVEDRRRDGSAEQVHSFGWYMAMYVAQARAKGADVIVCSPVPHRDQWEKGRDFALVAQWGEQVARAGGAQFVDLTGLVSDGYRAAGTGTVNGFFADARTHTNDAGASFNAARVVEGLRKLEGDPFGAFLAR